MEVNSFVEIVKMFCIDYLSKLFVFLLTLLIVKITYSFIKRRCTQTTIVDKTSTKDNGIHTNSENVLNESSPETLHLESEKKSELLICVDKEDNLDNKIHNDLLNVDTTLKTMNIKNVTGCSGYGSTEDEMQESKNYSMYQDVFDTCKLNSDSFSTINSWESCNNEISHSESDYVNSLSSENPEICQPLNLSMKDKKNETDTHKTARTFFTARKYKRIKDTLDDGYIDNLFGELVDDDDKKVLKLWNKLKNEFDILKNTKTRSSCNQNIKNSECSYDKENSLNNEQVENKLDDTEHFLNNEQVEYKLDDTEHSLNNGQVENKLDDTKHSLNNEQVENKLDDTEHSLNNDQVEYNLDDTEHELKNKKTMELTKLSSIRYYGLEDELILDNTKDFSNDDELMLENNLETTRLSPIELDYEYKLESPELSSLNNDKSFSGNGSLGIKCTHDYYEVVQGITEFNNASSSECTESLPSPIIFNNDSLIDDIRYVEDYNDLSFFDPNSSDDALNEAFVKN